MCGRFTRKVTWHEINQAMRIINPIDEGRNDRARYNIAPTQQLSFAVEVDSERKVVEGQWWLIPFWAKEQAKYPTFNARGETAHEKPTFRESFKNKRCLVPADGYYEWVKNAGDGKKDPYYITLADKQPFCFAGLWAYNTNLDITSFTILTLPAKPATEDIHHRMPVILKSDAYDQWMDAGTSVKASRDLLGHNLGDDLEYYRVDRAVNSSKQDKAEYISPLAISDISSVV